MEETKLGIVEAHFADIIWENAPLTTRELTKHCEELLHWKRTTTYTVLKKLCQRGIFDVQKGKVTVLISKDEFHAIRSEQFVQDNFQGSLPAFIAAFTTRKELTKKEMDEVQKLLDDYRREHL